MIGQKSAAMAELVRHVAAVQSGQERKIALPWPRLNSALGDGLAWGETSCLAGSPGSSKSFMVLELVRHAVRQGVPVACLPLEDSCELIARRALALGANTWLPCDLNQSNAGQVQVLLEQHREDVMAVTACYRENPRLGHRDDRGRVVVPPLPWQAVIAWIQREAENGAQLLVVDPASMIDFADENRCISEWAGQDAFMRQAVATARSLGVHILFVVHIIKRRGTDRQHGLSLDDLQGSASFGRFTHNAMLLASHDWQEATVYRAEGGRAAVNSNRVLTLAKSRNGNGAGARLAFAVRQDSPRPQELGVIAPDEGRRGIWK